MCKLWVWPWRYHPESRSWYDCVINHQDPTWQWGVMARTRIFSMCALWPWPWRYDLGSRSWHPWVMDNNVKYFPDPTPQWGVMARTQLFGMYALWPWHLRYDHRTRSWHNLGSWTISVWNIIPIQHSSEDLWPGHWFSVYMYMHCDLDLGDMTLGQGHDTPLGNGHQLCEIFSRSNVAVRSYGPDTDFGYVFIVTLTLEIWPWGKVMTHPWVMDNNCVKYYPDQIRG